MLPHIGNVELFPQTMLLVQKAEYEWPSPFGPRFKPEHPVTKLEANRYPLDAGAHSRPSIAAREITEDRRAGAVGRCRTFSRKLRCAPGALDEYQPRPDASLNAENCGHHGEGAGGIVDQPRQSAARHIETGA